MRMRNLLVAAMLPVSGVVIAVPSGSAVGAGVEPVGVDSTCGSFDLSPSGRYLVFSSVTSRYAKDTNSRCDVYLWDRRSGGFELVSQALEGSAAGGENPTISNDGRFVAFESAAANVVAGDTNQVRDVFVRDRANKVTKRVTVTRAGTQANGPSFDPQVAGYGGKVVFATEATNLVAGDTNAARDIVVWRRSSGLLTRVSVTAAGKQANGASTDPSVNDTGTRIAFLTAAPNMGAGPTTPIVQVRDLDAATTYRIPPICVPQGLASVAGLECRTIVPPEIGGLGTRVVMAQAWFDTVTNQLPQGISEESALYRVPDGVKLDSQLGWDLIAVAISPDGKEWAQGSERLISITGTVGDECIGDPDLWTRSMVFTGTDRTLAFVKLETIVVQPLNFADGVCIEL